MIGSNELRTQLVSAEKLLIASDFVEASKAADIVLTQLYANNAGLEELTRAWYTLIQAHYMQKDLQPLHRLLQHHHLPIRVLPPRVILLWGLVHLELGHTARARDDLNHWLMYTLVEAAVTTPANATAEAAISSRDDYRSTGSAAGAVNGTPLTLGSSDSGASEARSDSEAAGSKVGAIIAAVSPPRTPELANSTRHGGNSNCRTPELGSTANTQLSRSEFGNRGVSWGKLIANEATMWKSGARRAVGISTPGHGSSSSRVGASSHSKGRSLSKGSTGVFVAPKSWRLSGEDALALARLFAVEIMGKAQAEFSAARRWLQSDAEILSVSQVQLLLQELETAELVKIQEEEMLTQHAAQQAGNDLESPQSEVVPPLLNPQLRRRWRGGPGGGPSSAFLTMTGEMEELGTQAHWPPTPAKDSGSPNGHILPYQSGFSHTLYQGSAWVQLLWKGIRQRLGPTPRWLLLALCCALLGCALHTERSSIQRAAVVLWQRLRLALMDALGMALVLNANPIASAAAQVGRNGPPSIVPAHIG